MYFDFCQPRGTAWTPGSGWGSCTREEHCSVYELLDPLWAGTYADYVALTAMIAALDVDLDGTISEK